MKSSPQFETVLWSREGAVLTLTLNRPERLNAFSAELFRDLGDAVDAAARDTGIRVVVFTGAGRAFCSGADLTSVADYHTEAAGDALTDGIRQAQAVFDKVEALPQPTIAAMNGHAVGAGLQLALACDFRIAVRGAKLGLTDVKIGIVPALGATARLPRLIGVAKTKQLILIGELIGADDARAMGLVHDAVEPELLSEKVKALADTFCSRAPLAIAAAKRLINERASLDEVARVQSHLIKSADAMEGISAFFEKRQPDFKGK